MRSVYINSRLFLIQLRLTKNVHQTDWKQRPWSPSWLKTNCEDPKHVNRKQEIRSSITLNKVRDHRLSAVDASIVIYFSFWLWLFSSLLAKSVPRDLPAAAVYSASPVFNYKVANSRATTAERAHERASASGRAKGANKIGIIYRSYSTGRLPVCHGPNIDRL